MSQLLRVIFFGTPNYAVPTLKALRSDPRFDVRLVVTQPDRPAGRGRKLASSAVKLAAIELGLACHQPQSLKDEEARHPLKSAEADLFVVAAYGLIFGMKALELPRLGSLNLHASLLPAYRGASPVSAAILNGDAITGVSLMVMERGLDTGPVLATIDVSIQPVDTTESLTAKLAMAAAQLSLGAIARYASGELTASPQPVAGASRVRPLVKADGGINWEVPAEVIERHVRAMWPWPRAWTIVGGDVVQIHASTVVEARGGVPGSLNLDDDQVVVACGNGSLRLDLVQLPGGRPITGSQFLASGKLNAAPRLASVDPPVGLSAMIEAVS